MSGTERVLRDAAGGFTNFQHGMFRAAKMLLDKAAEIDGSLEECDLENDYRAAIDCRDLLNRMAHQIRDEALKQ